MYMPSEANMNGNNMNYMPMLLNWNTEGLYVVFSWWHPNNIGLLLLSMLFCVLLAIVHEFLKYLLKYDLRLRQSPDLEKSKKIEAEKIIGISYNQRVLRTLVFSAQTILAYFLMLIVMTYNGFFILAVVLGAAIGYFIWGMPAKTNSSVEASTVCH
ncbi:12681_t:CDS:2 [Acaulospora morrowiae]|uniref:Copper transport protein n=1 Tax=Acaulospora morrowiae TaxID=94023 RepID=A0A9N8YQK9_9GLOM|nr:12681_t:CDS:2 [Acaulospora morrowiae]